MSPRFPHLLVAALTLAALGVSSSVQAEDEKRSATDRYKVPKDADVDGLVKFIEGLEDFQPNSAAEQLAHRTNFPKAIKQAAEKIVELEKNKQATSLKVAKRAELTAGLRDFFRGPPNRQADFVVELIGLVKTHPSLSIRELRLANTVTQILERGENRALQAEAFKQLGTAFSKSEDETLSTYGELWLGSARRMNLVGNELTLEGATVDGEPFDWKTYRGKVVLVDFWATWCGPCIAEIPNVVKNYEKYHARGFEVVGISLDQDRDELVAFLADRKLPWLTLFDPDADGQHPMATYYGISAIPTVFLVDKEGKVVSLDARGSQLGRQLEKLLGGEQATESGAE